MMYSLKLAYTMPFRFYCYFSYCCTCLLRDYFVMLHISLMFASSPAIWGNSTAMTISLTPWFGCFCPFADLDEDIAKDSVSCENDIEISGRNT